MSHSNDRFLFGPCDPMNFISPDDRIFEKYTVPNRPAMKIPVLDIHKQMAEDYCDHIEKLYLELTDQQEATKLAESIANTFRQQVNDLNDRITSYQAAVRERSYAVSRCTSLESDVRKLSADLKTEIGNRDHFRALVVQQDAFIKEAKRQIEEYKLKKEGELRVKTSEAEHLAKQAVRLNDNITKFSAQNVRLIDENRKLQDKMAHFECEGCRTGEMGTYCGGCIGCHVRQVEHSHAETDKALARAQKVAPYKDKIIATLKLYIFKFKNKLMWQSNKQIFGECACAIEGIESEMEAAVKETQKL